MPAKSKPTENLAKDTEAKSRRKTLAAELGELVLQRTKLAEQIQKISERCSQIAQQMENL